MVPLKEGPSSKNHQLSWDDYNLQPKKYTTQLEKTIIFKHIIKLENFRSLNS